MSKRLIMILALAFVLGISVAAYAEVQNVKVSGDITAGGVYRNNFDLTKTPIVGSGHTAANYDDQEKDFFSITRVRVDADLTDNVTATVRLLNERNWNGESSADELSEANRNIGLSTTSTYNTEGIEDRVNIDLAYVTLKEFLYSPLSVMVGRQELHYGNDFIMGDPDTNGYALRSALAEGDLSARKAFDAVRVVLDYNPLVIDGFFAKLAENSTVKNDDTTAYGLNASYALDKNTTLEGYYFGKIKGANAPVVTNVDSGSTTSFDIPEFKNKSDQVHTVGIRAVNKTVKNLTLDGQFAYQFGTYNPKFDPNARYVSTTDKAETVRRSAWAIEAIANYDLKDTAMIGKYSPSISGTYVYYRGANRDQTGKKKYKGWDPMFENQTIGHILNAISMATNRHLAALTLQAKPVEDVSVKVDCVGAWFAKTFPDTVWSERRKYILSGVNGARQFRMSDKSFLGQEYDVTLTYDYTEDVQFALLGGVFLPTKAARGDLEIVGGDEQNLGGTAATEVIGSMKVTF